MPRRSLSAQKECANSEWRGKASRRLGRCRGRALAKVTESCRAQWDQDWQSLSRGSGHSCDVEYRALWTSRDGAPSDCARTDGHQSGKGIRLPELRLAESGQEEEGFGVLRERSKSCRRRAHPQANWAPVFSRALGFGSGSPFRLLVE